MMMNTMHKPKSRKAVANLDLRTFIAGGIEGILCSRRFVSAKEGRETGNESTLETARVAASRCQNIITERAFAGADKVMAFMGEQKDAMSRGTEFTRSLAQEFSVARLTGVRADKAGIIIWSIKCYMDAQKEAPKAAPVVESRTVACPATRIVALFAKATEAKLAHPKIRLSAEGVGKVVFSVAGSRSKFAGDIMITDGKPFGQNVFFGRITRTGEMVPSKACSNTVRDLIVALANDPAGVARAHGHLHGNCCFCGRGLETGESVAVGYGPICADKFGLPWGEVKAKAVVEEDRREA